MPKSIAIGNCWIGDGHPVYIIAEIGLNHNGDLDIAKQLIDVAVEAGCDAVKFQKRTPEICVPIEQRDIPRETPWGTMTYMEYRNRVEFGVDEYSEIDLYCRQNGIQWMTSCWDEEAVDFVEAFNPIGYKVASASVTDLKLLRRLNDTGRPIILSTGMSTMDEITQASDMIDSDRLLIAHCTSAYPSNPDELNLRMIDTFGDLYPDTVIGYSGHEIGLQTSYAAIAMGAKFIERHITLDRAMWGSDHAASVEPAGFNRLVRDIRVIERALGDGIKQVYDSEMPLKKKLRRV